MRIKNAFKLLGADFAVVYKLLLYRFVVSLLIYGVGIAAIFPYGSRIIMESGVTDVLRSGVAVISNLFLPSAEFVPTFAEDWAAFTGYIANNLFNAYWLIFYFIGIYALAEFFKRYGNYALGHITNAHMESMQKLGFLPALFRSFGKATLYSLIETAISLGFLVLSAATGFLISFIPFGDFAIFSLILLVFSSIMIHAFKRTLVSLYMPSMITDKMGAVRGFNNGVGLAFGDFWRIYSSYCFMIIAGIYFNISVALFTVGTGLLFSIPLTVIFFVNFQFVNYYKLSVKKYFISYDVIVVPKEMREEESLLTDIDI